jgi:pyruvate,orthophosphate dikinase
MSELSVLQAMRLKGRLTADAASACVGESPDQVQPQLDALVAQGLAKQAGTAVRVTPEGRERLTSLLETERSTVDQAKLTEAYHAFDEHNNEMKAIMHAWQLRDDGTPNDHTDEAYDATIVERLAALHERFEPLVQQVVALTPRLAPYLTRFGSALDQVRAGDHSFIARPIADSYHTVWFEFHEELIGLLGRTRAEEAAAGRAV